MSADRKSSVKVTEAEPGECASGMCENDARRIIDYVTGT